MWSGKLGFFLLLLPLLAGCLEEDKVEISPDFKLRENLFLTEFYESNELAFGFKYNGDNQMIEQVVQTAEGNELSKLSYNGNGKIAEMESVTNGRKSSQAFYYNFILGENKIDSIVYFLDGSLWGIRKMIYNNLGFISRIMEYNAGSPLIFNDYEWDNGNVIRRTRYFPREDSTDIVRWVYTFTYDSAKNPFHLVYKDIGFHIINREPISINNWNKLVIRRYPEDITLQTVEKSFSYINPGYPVRKRTTVIGYNNQLIGELVSDFIY